MERRTRYGAALVLLMLAYVLDGIPDREGLGLVSVLAVVGLIVLIVLDERNPRWMRVAGLAGAGLIAPAVAGAAFADTDTFTAVSLFAFSALVLLAIVSVLRNILGQSEIDLPIVMGAVVAYALIAFMAASLFHAVDLVTNDPFFAQGEATTSDYTYFAFVVLTTLGFGDLTPGTELAKRMVVIEVFVGQVFLVVLVARLVSLWGPRDRSNG